MTTKTIIEEAKKERLNYVMRTSLNKNEYEEFKAACADEDLTPAEVIRAFIKQYLRSYSTESALYDAANGINLSGPFDSGKAAIEDALNS